MKILACGVRSRARARSRPMPWAVASVRSSFSVFVVVWVYSVYLVPLGHPLRVPRGPVVLEPRVMWGSPSWGPLAFLGGRGSGLRGPGALQDGGAGLRGLRYDPFLLAAGLGPHVPWVRCVRRPP